MFDADELDLGARRPPVAWAVSLTLEQCRPQKHKHKRQQREAAAAAAAACKQQQRQEQSGGAASQQQHVNPLSVTPAQAKHHREYRDASCKCLANELEHGNVEYKFKLTGCVTNENRQQQLITQMKYRLSEGGGECFYYLGVEDDGYPRGLDDAELAASLAVLSRMAASLQATARLVEYVAGGFGRRAALLHIKTDVEDGMAATDCRIAVAGSMDAGKSTLVAVLTHGSDGRPLLDNGRGAARMAVFRHKHEIESGRTSSISQQVLCYDASRRVLNYAGVASPTPAELGAAAAAVLTFIDIAGHARYMKTALYGMTCGLPDYALLCVDACSGVGRITREHLAVAVALEVPTALVVTKADAVDGPQLAAVLEQLRLLMAPLLDGSAAPGSSGGSGGSGGGGSGSGGGGSGAAAADGHGALPVVSSEAEALALADTLCELHGCTAGAGGCSFTQAVFPVFQVSCVTGAGLPLLHAFLSRLRPPSQLHRAAGSCCGSSGNLLQEAGPPVPAATACTERREGAVAGTTAGAACTGAGAAGSNAGAAGEEPGARACSPPEACSQLWGVLEPPGSSSGVASSGVASSGVASSGVASRAESAAAAAAAAAGGASGGAAELLPAAEAASAAGAPGPPDHFQVVHTFDVQGVGSVVSGIAVAGSIEVGQSLLWGPDAHGGFSPVRVSCIQRSHVPVRQVAPGQTATLALQPAGPGDVPACSKQALLSAAAAAQAAAAEQAAREAAAAIAAVPAPPVVTRRRSPAAVAAAAARARATAAALGAAAAAAPVPGPAAAGAAGDECLDSLLADEDFAAQLALDGSDDEELGAQARPCGEAGSGDAFCLDLFAADAAEEPGSPRARSSSSSSCSSSCAASRASLSHSWSVGSCCAGGDSGGDDTPRAPQLQPQPQPAGAAAAAGARSAPPPQLVGGSGADGSRGSRAAAGLPLLGSSPSSSPSSWRSKGGVLLDAAAAPRTYWEFNALLVLLGGHWPPRGLLSGRWPLRDEGGGDDAGAAPPPSLQAGHAAAVPQGSPLQGSPPAAAAQPAPAGGRPSSGSGGGLSKQRSKRYEFAFAIHCNSIRQIARVVSMAELRASLRPGDVEDSGGSSGDAEASGGSSGGGGGGGSSGEASPGAAPREPVQQRQQPLAGAAHAVPPHCGLSASIHAAAALLLQGHRHSSSSDGTSGGSADGGRRVRRLERAGSGGGRAPNTGSVVAVRFRFAQRPEWMQLGARLIVRDRSDGHVAAAGFVTQLLEPHEWPAAPAPQQAAGAPGASTAR